MLLVGGNYIGFGNQEQLDAGCVLLRGVGGIRVDGSTEDTLIDYRGRLTQGSHTELSGGFSNQEALSFLCTAAVFGEREDGKYMEH